MDLKLGQKVYHKDIYWGKEQMKVVGLREAEIELEGDYSGGTHSVCQKSWHPLGGVLLEKNEVADCSACYGAGVKVGEQNGCYQCEATGQADC